MVELAGDYKTATMEEKVVAQVKAHDDSPVPIGDGKVWVASPSAAVQELMGIVTQAQAKVDKALSDPRLPPPGQEVEAAEARAEAAELVRAWEEKHTEGLTAQIEAAIPTPKATNPPPTLQWVQGIERQVEGRDELELSLVYLDPETPPEVCRVLESMAPAIDIKTGKVTSRISEANRRARARMEAGPGAVEREAGLGAIRSILGGLAGVALGELEERW